MIVSHLLGLSVHLAWSIKMGELTIAN
jgi:hypothetical protein